MTHARNVQLLFVQGAGEHAHDQWDNKLVDSLQRTLGAEYEIRYPRMPNEADPQFEAWSAVIAHELATLRDRAIVVGHSIGGAILVNALAKSESPIALGAIVLVAAPFVGEGGWPADGFSPSAQLGADLPANVPVLLYLGDADTTVPMSHLELYAKAIPGARTTQLANRDHQLNNDLSEVAAAIQLLAP